MLDQPSATTRAKRFAISVAIILLFSTLYGCGARIVHAQTPTALPPQIKTRYFDSKGKPLAGGQLFTYSAGTTTPLATFTDATGTVQNPDPVILDSTGAASVWLSQNSAYKFVLEDVNGVIQWTVDNVTVSNSTGQSTIFTGGTILNATVFQNGLSDTGGAVNFSAGPTHTLPIKVGTVAGLPATCTIGEEYFATDAIAGENVYLCSATNTWTQQGFGLPFNFIAAGTNLNHLTMGNGSTFDTTGTAIVNFGTASATTPAAVGAALPATCSVGQIFFNTAVTAGSNVYLCTSTNTWTQVSGSGSSTPSWASVLGGATNTGTGFVLAPTVTGTIPWTVNCPPGLTVDCFLVQKNGVNQFEVQQGSLVVVDVPLTVNGNLQATAGYALAGGGSITGSVALGTTTLQGNLFSSASTTVDFHNASHTLAFVSGTMAAKPASCTQGEEYFATDATAGVNLFFCTSTNTWTQMTGGGSNPIWSTVQGSSTNTNTGFVLAPTATGTIPWTVNCPSGITVDCVAFQINGVNQFEVTPTFLSLDVTTHILGNIQASNGLAVNAGGISVIGNSSFVNGVTFNAGVLVGNSANVDFHNAAHTISTVSGLTASKPATCTAGELYFATDATAGQNLFECATTNTWTQQLNSGGGGLLPSGSPLNHQYAIFSPDGTHLTGVTPGTTGLPLVSNGTSTDPSAQQLPVASVVPSANNGDNLCTTSGAAAWCTPGITINSITGTTYTVASADRGDRDQFTGTAASAWTLPKAGSAGFGNNFFFTVPNFSANNVNVTITPTTSNCNGGLNCIVGQGQIAYLTSDPTANSGNGSYYAHIGWNTLSSGNLVTIAPSQYGGTVDLTAAVPISLGGTGQTTQQAGFNALACTPTRAGDVTYYNGTNWVCLAGNNSGTQVLQENASGVPSWAAAGSTHGEIGGTTAAAVPSGTQFMAGVGLQPLQSTRPAVQTVMPVGGTLANFRVVLSAAEGAAATLALTIETCTPTAGACTGAATTITCTVGNSVNNCSDLTHTATISAGDFVDVTSVQTGTGTSQIIHFSYTLQ